ncbi:fimbria/pilus outer membrane usher protein [Sphingopyxis sp. JAI128]|uniref:fimbria/pilus outer membrane usher protein n=1 Tax=Sphingopyxis sp. JAI128 TaxID=2723066 RepID=UPI00160F14D7|nr:fimbria/pilus outer membrane usher protein [Sphingopyxis sp. JAI128]MBB6428170.1 outer membrane usher protein [Sphingopyxis sp. JAI128]
MRPPACPGRNSRVLLPVLTGLCAAAPVSGALARDFPSTSYGAAAAYAAPESDLQLEVFVNGEPTKLVAAFREEAGGTLLIDPTQLRNVGLQPDPRAVRPDGLVDIARLPGVSFAYDEARQRIDFTATPESRATRVIDAGGRGGRIRTPPAQRDFGALVNYTLFATAGDEGSSTFGSTGGVSGMVEGRVFGPQGLLSSSHIVRASSGGDKKHVRLATSWSYSDPGSLIVYRAADIVSGGLQWTRSVRLGGIQIQRDFGLRPDLVTIPLLDLSGSAAVPSTVEVYVNNVRRLSTEVEGGPIRVANVPIITDAGVARLVVTDALGRETVSQSSFFASPLLLAPGLWDFSVEAGFARQNFGSRSNDYGGDLMMSGTVRRGLSDWLTLEGHAEGGGGLGNGGIGAAFNLGSFAIGSLAGSASRYRGDNGYQLAGSLQLALGDLRLNARSQHSFGDYHDIASVTFDASNVPTFDWSLAAPPKAIDQVTISGPLPFDRTRMALSYTRLETAAGNRSQLLSVSTHRSFSRRGILYASLFKDFERRKSLGIFVGLSFRFGGRMQGSVGVSSRSGDTYVTTELARRIDDKIGSYGWRLRSVEGDRTQRLAAGSYRAAFARLKGGVEQIGDDFRATAQIDGSVVVAGGGLFLANRIDDAFAVVDTGAPGIDVAYENRPIGRSNGDGKLLLPYLRSWQPNRISIDPRHLPLDARVGGTREVAVPADRSGVTVRFDVDAETPAALIVLRDPQGALLPLGATGRVEGNPETFIVGYDGQAYAGGLGPQNRAVVALPDGGRCVADFAYQSQPGRLATLSGVICRPLERE